MALLDSVAASASSVGAALLVCLMGALWARLRAIDGSFWREASRMNADILTPALCFHTMVKAVSPADLQELWVVPVASVLHILLGLVLGGTAGRLLLRPEQRSDYTLLAMLASSMGNGFALPLPLVLVLCKAVPWLSDEGSTCAERATGILIVWGVSMLMALWSLGYLLVFKSVARSPKLPPADEVGHSSDAGDEASAQSTKSAGASAHVSLPPAPSHAESVPDCSAPSSAQRSVSHASMAMKMAGAAGHNCQEGAIAIKQMLNPVLLSSLAGLGVAMLGPVRDSLNGSLVMAVLGTPSSACVPVTLLCIGGQMVVARRASSGQASGTIALTTMVSLALLRLVVVNAIWAAVVIGAIRLGVVPAEDRLLQLCLLVQGAMPTAANVVLLCGVLDAFPREISRLVLVMQVICVPCIAVSLVIYLELVG